MILKEFIEEQKLALIAFEEYWNHANKIEPENFPLVLNAGDWDEQLRIFDAVIK